MLDDFCDNAFEAMSSANLEFRVALAESFVEEASIDEHSVDVVTVAQGLHWFDTDAFFRQCQLALKPTGILAVWGYGSWWYPDNAAANHAMKVSRCWVTKGARGNCSRCCIKRRWDRIGRVQFATSETAMPI